MDITIFEMLQDVGQTLKNRPYLSKAKDFYFLHTNSFFLDTQSFPNEETNALDVYITLKSYNHPENLFKPIEERDFSLDKTQEYYELGKCCIQIASYLCERDMEYFISTLDGESRELFEIGKFLFEENDKNLEDPYEHRFDRWVHIKEIRIKEEYRNKGLGGAFFRMIDEQFGFSGSLVTLKSFPLNPSEDKETHKIELKNVKSFWKNRGFKKLHKDFVILKSGDA